MRIKFQYIMIYMMVLGAIWATLDGLRKSHYGPSIGVLATAIIWILDKKDRIN